MAHNFFNVRPVVDDLGYVVIGGEIGRVILFEIAFFVLPLLDLRGASAGPALLNEQTARLQFSLAARLFSEAFCASSAIGVRI